MKKLVIIAILGNFGSIWSKIIEIKDLNQVGQFIDSENPLIIFDMDKTLIQDDIVRFDEAAPLLEELSGLDIHRLKGLFYKKETQRNIKNIINNLQNQHKVIILTRSRRLDPFYKLSQAKQIGLDFNQAFPNLPLIKLEGSNGKAIFNNGIICCGENDKGETLTQFMEKIDYIPSEIIFVDDKLHNLVNVESYMKRLQIPVTGLWYTRIHRSN